MTYSSRNISYEVVSTILTTEVNDCYIARREGSDDGREYNLLVIKDHETVKDMMEVFNRDTGISDTAIIDNFSSGQSYIVVFPYRQERPLEDFFVGEVYSLPRCENICMNILLNCISSRLPYPLLYMILDQGQVSLSKDDSIYFGYTVDLTKLDKTKGERECAVRCADIMLKVLAAKSDQKNVSYELLSKKTANNSYSHFTELYRDLSIASTPIRKSSFLVKIKSFFYRNSDRLFGILFWVCLILGIVALVLLLTHLVWGDIPFLRIFFNSFKNIGTETLLQ
ncbi:MAG: hypothetical protein K6G03_08925 [Lachnospiraceae bacterium]|nr:hypothetical protein [Lachnospiraceae bacterium]